MPGTSPGMTEVGCERLIPKSIKLSAIRPPPANPACKSRGGVNLTFGRLVHAPGKIGVGIMSVLKEIAAAIVGVYALLSVCDAAFGVGRFDDDYYRASFYAPRPKSEPRLASDVTPAERVSDAFALFTPGEVKPKRYSSLPTIIR